MGNQPSTETQPRRAPQKLSKPRVGNHTASSAGGLHPTTGHHPHPASASAPAIGRFSNSYLVAGAPPAEAQEPMVGGVNETIIEDAELMTNVEEGRRTGLFRSSTVQPERVTRRQSTGLMPSKTFHGIERPKSVVHKAPTSPLTSVTSFEQLRLDRRASTYNPTPLDQYRLCRTPDNAKVTSPVTIQPDIPEALPTIGANQEAMNGLLGRSESEVSLYAPVRRRSAIHTPGVATRSEAEPKVEEHPVPRKRSHRNSLPSRCNSLEQPPTVRPHSMLPSPSCGTPDRVATPSENDYKSLGAIRFGSLRVTNGTPVSSPGDGLTPRDEINLMETSPFGPAPQDHDPPITEIQQPKPISPLVASFGQSSSSPTESNHSPFSQPSDGAKGNDATLLTPVTQPSLYEDNDVHLEMGRTSTEAPVKQQAVTEEVTRPVSGAGSKSSCSSSTGPPSKADSGYGSSLSLKSFLGSRKKKKEQQQQAKQAQAQAQQNASQEQPQVLEKRPTLQHHSPYQPSTAQFPSPETGHEPSIVAPEEEESQVKPISRTGSFIGSFKSRKAKESRTKVCHSRGSSSPEVRFRQEPLETAIMFEPTTVFDAEETKAKTITKLVNSARRRSLPNMASGDPNSLERIPSMPSDAGAKVEEHSRNFEASAARFSLKATPQMPTEIVVESREVRERSPQAATLRGYHRPRKSLGSESMQQRKPGRTPSAPSSRSMGNRKSILRKVRPQTDHSDDDDDFLPDYVLGYEAQVSSIDNIRRSAGDSAFDAAFAPLPPTHVPSKPPRRAPHTRTKTPEDQAPHGYPRLRTRSSAPDFLETVSEPASPGSVSCYSQKQPKTPPPISIRTRGSKKKRRAKSGRPPPLSPYAATPSFLHLTLRTPEHGSTIICRKATDCPRANH
ncbi:uncharacterized protein J7T54_008532 [Emericellopsis cladophorae]|uniref:Uncharacterized protein n=1 Tax=Emericellopsis cladophorae TaxID=2686198 RepID=A0A9P9Y0B5_9HYPO|nr:uncharacterized protein J7T54_008532 [Emericellopsis cladophorae]KAI6780614.1 hypothetical protein J7T54_008532 [Emericellopsis cladophorae]